jgi:ABC-type methionine transport system ATPase subunit
MIILPKNEIKQGYLELIIGPMYAGKSTELIRIINRYKCLNKNIIVINHKLNNRYGSIKLTTHNKEIVDNCIIFENLSDALSIPDTALNLIGKPEVKGKRRMGVALALGHTLEEDRKKAVDVARKVSLKI